MQENLSENIIEVKNLVRNFKEIKAVRDITFCVKKGESFAFLGPNGAGKTTTIRMLTTLLEPTSGDITLNSFNAHKNPNETRHSFGIVFQDPSLDTELTAYENMYIHAVLYGLKKEIYIKRIEELMKMVELWDRKDDLVKNFSGGMKRRLEIARGLLHHPKVLFLDEPTIGLDPQTRNYMWNYIKELREKEGLTVFFTTHYMEEVDKNADQIAIIDHGIIVAQGKSEDLKRKTNTTNLEDAFLALTGKDIRESFGSDGANRMKMWHGKR